MPEPTGFTDPVDPDFPADYDDQLIESEDPDRQSIHVPRLPLDPRDPAAQRLLKYIHGRRHEVRGFRVLLRKSRS